MSHRTLERVFVRMLFDPAFVDAVYADAADALAGLDLTPAEVANIVETDRRSWGHDPLRRLRTLRTLFDEFKASSTMVMAATRSMTALDAFFSGREFHAAVQHRGSLAGAFAAFLERIRVERAIDEPLLCDVLRLEAMMARCRRALEASAMPAEGVAARTAAIGAGAGLNRTVAFAAGHAVGRFDANVVEAVNAVEKYLFEVGLMPAVALCDDAPRLGGMPGAAGVAAFLLALPSGSAVSLMPVDEDYFQLLDAFSGGARRLGDAFRGVKGVSREDLLTMAESLVEGGVLEIVSPR